jgi:hypothetical protein
MVEPVCGVSQTAAGTSSSETPSEASACRVLRPDGLYVANLIDFEPLAFARAEAATLLRAFDHVAVAAEPSAFGGTGGGNLVAIASDSPIDITAVERGFDRQRLAWDVIDGVRLTAWIDRAAVLSDDYAPVDQLLTPQYADSPPLSRWNLGVSIVQAASGFVATAAT